MKNFGYWGGRSEKKKKFSKTVFFIIADELEAEDDVVFSNSSLQMLSTKVVSPWAPHLRRLIRDRATRDTDKPEAQPVNKPRILYSFVFS